MRRLKIALACIAVALVCFAGSCAPNDDNSPPTTGNPCGEPGVCEGS